MKRGQDLYTEIHRLYQAGHAMRAITRQLGQSRATIYRYLALKEFPPKFTRQRAVSILDPYEDYLSQRWKAGCRNAAQLLREIQPRGYPGTRKQVSQWVYERREQVGASTPHRSREAFVQDQHNSVSNQSQSGKTSLPAASRLVWIFLKPTDKLTAEEIQLRTCLVDHKILARALELGEEFQRMVQEREAQGFSDWLAACESSKIPELRNLALAMRKDFSAIQNAMHSPWSNGQTEGQVNRLKLLKRQMYGRAKFDLLRLRCLHPP